jgi:hypothetical protein
LFQPFQFCLHAQLSPRLPSAAEAALVVEAFMGAAVAASTQVVEAECIPAAGAECVQVLAAASAEDHRPLALAIHVGHLVHLFVLVALLSGLAPILHVPLAIQWAEARGWGIPHQLVPLWATADGIRLEAHLGAADPRRFNPNPDPLLVQVAVGTSSAQIVGRDQPRPAQ